MLLDHVSFSDAAERLLLTVAAGAVIGLDRDKGGHPAGLGTTILVCLAAGLAMLEANLLLPTSGKTPQSFAQLDFMRLPLGILTGMGFLGAGAILRRGNRIAGLTTAATLWVTTVIGLCFGAGEIALGVAGTILCVAVGVSAKRVEALLAKDQTAALVVETASGSRWLEALEHRLGRDGFSVVGLAQVTSVEGHEYRLQLRRRSREPLLHPPRTIAVLMEEEGIRRVAWLPDNAPDAEGASL